MVNSIETIYQLENLKPSERLEFIKSISNLHSDLKGKLLKLFYLTYDNNINYNITLTSKEKKQILKLARNEEDCNLEEVLKFIEYVRDHIKSKKQFQDLLHIGHFNNIPIYFNEKDWNLIFKIFDRNLNIGYEQIVKYLKKTIVEYLTNENYQKYKSELLNYKHSFDKKLKHILPYFPFQLAEKADKLEKIKDQEFLIQPKLDGIRIVIDRNGYIYTRNHEYFHFTERPYLIPVVQQVLKIYDNIKNTGILFDGEIFFKDFPTTQSLFSMKEKKPEYKEYEDKLQFHIFDIVKEDWFLSFDFSEEFIYTDIQIHRYQFLNKLFIGRDQEFNLLKVVEGKIISKNEIEENTLEYISLGYEGSMVKRLNGHYQEGRNTNWIKIKPIKEMEVIVLDVIEGEGRLQNMAGSLLVQNKEGKIFRCSGLSDKQRKEFWNNKDDIIGKVIEIKYQELTQDGIPRFPRFYRIRSDKTVNNIN